MLDYEINESFELSTDDEKLETIFSKWLASSKSYHDKFLTKQNYNFEYYIGNQTERSAIPRYNCDTVENRIFEAVETLVPIATSNPHRFVGVPATDKLESRERAAKVGTVLDRKYDELEIQEVLEDITRRMLVMYYGVAKWGWDDEKDDVMVKSIDPRLILVPPLNCKFDDLPYVIEIQSYSKEEMKKNWPDFDLGSLNSSAKVDVSGLKDEKDYQVFEVWTDEMVAWFCNGKLLEKIENPYFSFEEEEKKRYNRKTKKIEKEKKRYNYFKYPRKPYVLFGTFNLSLEVLPSTCLVEQAISIQDAINVQKRSIIDNLKKMGNGQVYVDSDAMTEEEANNITSEPGSVLRGKMLASENKIRREAGVPIPNSHFSNLTHSESMFDNLMGLHSATRGSAAAETLGQDMMSRQQDYTRIDLITRVLNRGLEKIAEGLVQVMKQYYDKKHVIRILGSDGAIQFIDFTRDDIDDNIEVIVKAENSFPMDEMTKRTEAIQLWQLGALAPITLFERLKFANPAREAAAVLAWKQGQLDMETQAVLAKQAKQGEIQAANQKAAGEQRMAEKEISGANENEAPESKIEGSQETGVENMQEVIKRAKEKLSQPIDVNTLIKR